MVLSFYHFREFYFEVLQQKAAGVLHLLSTMLFHLLIGVF